MPDFSADEKKQAKNWLLRSFKLAQSFDGSEAAEQKLVNSLSLFEAFVRASTEDAVSDDYEEKIASIIFPDHPIDMPLTINGFLDLAGEFYDRLNNADSSEFDIWAILENGGAVINQSESIFVQTDDGSIQPASSNDPKSYQIRTEPRLAALITRLRNEGVNGQSIYIDDLVITKGTVHKEMVRKHPYIIIQIPRVNAEIAICEQIGETTFVKKGTVGPEFWAYMSKDQLKAREDVLNINRHNDQQWWGDISAFLSGDEKRAKKVNIASWIKRKSKLDIELIKMGLLAHRLETGEWLTKGKKGADGKKNRYVLEYGPYAGKVSVGNLDAALVQGLHGLFGGSSIAQLNAEVSEEYNLDYSNHLQQDKLDIKLAKESLLAHRLETGEWLLNNKKGANGKIGGYVLEYGPYAGMISVHNLNAYLHRGLRGLSGGSSIAALNAEISEEYNLDYSSNFDKEDLDLELVKDSLLAHRLETGEWLSNYKKEPDGKVGSYVLEYGPYAGMISVHNLNAYLHRGARGLSGGSSIAALNAEISEEYGLDYVNIFEQEDLDLELVKASLLAHRLETGEWLSICKKGLDGHVGGYVLEYGPYAEVTTVTNLQICLRGGGRGLPGGSSIAKLNDEIAQEHNLDRTSRPTLG